MFVEACDHMPAMYVLFSGLSESFATFEMPIIAFFSRFTTGCEYMVGDLQFEIMGRQLIQL